MRDYTPRRYDLDTLELDIDFVLHGDGPASTWAEQAKPGQFLHIGGPRGSMIVPDIFDSYLLIGDETALPAIARRLEGLAAESQGAGGDRSGKRRGAASAGERGPGQCDLGAA